MEAEAQLPQALGRGGGCDRRTGLPEIEGLIIGVTLVYPTLLGGALGAAFPDGLRIFWNALPVAMPPSGDYSSSVLPVIAAVAFAAWLRKKIDKVIPDTIKLFATSLITLIITIPLTFLVVGPLTSGASNLIGDFFNWLSGISSVLIGAVVGAAWQILVLFGLHWASIPLMMNNMSAIGYDPAFVGMMGCSFTQVGAVAAIWAKTKNKKMKSLCPPAAISAVAGVTEPAIYGITLPKKTPFIISCVVSSVAGAAMGLMNVKLYQLAGMGVFGLTGFIDSANNDLSGMISTIVICLVAVVATFVLVYITYHDEPSKKKAAAPAPAAEPTKPAATVSSGQSVVVSADAKGKVLPMEEVPDPVFSQGVLGLCCGIEPVEGKVYAPVDGEVTNIADSQHAIGFDGPGGAEILIHVGVDTVEMNGDGFAPQVKVGDTVKKGQLVMIMDLDKIKAAGHPATVITVVTNSDDYSSVDLVGSGDVNVGDDLFKLNS